MKIEVLEKTSFKAKTAELAMAQELNTKAEDIVVLADEAARVVATVNKILQNTDVQVSLEGIINGDELQLAMIRLIDIRTIADGFIRYCQGRFLDIDEKKKEFAEKIEKLNKELGELSEKLNTLNEANVSLKEENSRLVALVNDTKKENESLKEQLNKAKQIDTNKVDMLLKLFEDNVKSISVSEKMKLSQGRKEDTRITNKVKEYYTSGITPVALQRKLSDAGYKISLPTIIKRLEEIEKK